MRLRACSSLSPSSRISAIRRSAMPSPAEPEPNMAMVCSLSGRPVAWTAASSAPGRIVAVPRVACRGRIGEEEAARPAPDLAEALAALSHDRGVNDRQQLFRVVRNQRVEKRFAIVLQVAHVAVLAKGGIATGQHSQAAFPLIFQGSDMRRQKAMQAECGAFLFGKGRAFVEPGIMEQLEPVKSGANHVRVCLV